MKLRKFKVQINFEITEGEEERENQSIEQMEREFEESFRKDVGGEHIKIDIKEVPSEL